MTLYALSTGLIKVEIKREGDVEESNSEQESSE